MFQPMPRVTAAAVLSILLWPGAALGQIPGVDIFVDQQVNESGERSRCDLINAANADLVVLSDTAELMLVSTQDTILEDTFVDEDNNVFIGDQPVGFIDFASRIQGQPPTAGRSSGFAVPVSGCSSAWCCSDWWACDAVRGSRRLETSATDRFHIQGDSLPCFYDQTHAGG